MKKNMTKKIIIFFEKKLIGPLLVIFLVCFFCFFCFFLDCFVYLFLFFCFNVDLALDWAYSVVSFVVVVAVVAAVVVVAESACGCSRFYTFEAPPKVEFEYGAKTQKYARKWKFWSKMEILVKNRNFCLKSKCW